MHTHTHMDTDSNINVNETSDIIILLADVTRAGQMPNAQTQIPVFFNF